MKLKKLTAMVSSAVMVMSLFAGIAIAKPANAAVNAELPKTNGLYLAEWVDRDWGQEKPTARTDTDANGNTVLVDGGGEYIHYKDWDNPDYLTDGVKDGWGPDFNVSGEDLWFDYIEGTKVTHVTLDQLSLTALDGSPCDWAKFEVDENDPRVIRVSCSKTDLFLVTYNGAAENNKMVMMPDLRTAVFSGTKYDIESLQNPWNVYKKGTTVGYVHFSRSWWEDASFIVDPKTAVGMEYFDPKKDDIVHLDNASKYVTLKPVSTKDSHHLIYKILMTCPPGNDGWTDLIIKFKCYDGKHQKSEAWDEESWVHVEYIDGTAPAPGKGTTDVFDGVTYKVAAKNSASLSKGANQAKITVPAKVSIDGTSFAVTGIDANAFKGCAKVKNIAIKATTIKSVGKNAMKALKSTTVISVPKAKKAAYEKMFKAAGFKGVVK